MLIYRIMLAKYGDKLLASGKAARWNSEDVEVIYNASSRSLACLEIAVHRELEGLSHNFNVLTLNIPDRLKIKTISLKNLPAGWFHYAKMQLTQAIGDQWIAENHTVILQVPSAIVNEEVNYLLNPHHPDFKFVKIIKVQPFVFDSRIKT